MAMIHTTHGLIDECELEKREGTIDDDIERTTWVEYWCGEELVHRSAHVTVKTSPFGLGSVASFGSEER